jgi:Tol biopolymer transport system component
MARWQRSRVASGLGALTLMGSLTVVSVTPASAAFPGRNGPILCASSRTGDAEIFSFNPDGSDPRNLTNHPGADLEATMSPDGTRIAFTSNRTGDQEIWIMYQDGSGLRQLTFTPGEDRPGTFSPDGTRLAFHSARFPAPPGPGHSSLEVLTMNIDGSDVRRLTNNNFQDTFAHWSPNGDRIVFTTNRDSFVNANGQLVANFEVYSMVPVDANNDGNADVQTNLTNTPGEDAHGHWSPDGSQITFHSRRDFLPSPTGFQIEIYRMNADGSNPVRLTGPDNEFDAFPAWSPDGQRIVWSRFFPSEGFTMNAVDGSGQFNVTQHPTDDTRCDWGRLLPCTITGAGDITGTEGDDVICGSDGNDRIAALGGNDVIYAGRGDDQVSAAGGRDTVFGGPGVDRIVGGDGDDILFGDQDGDFISAGAGNDVASGSEASDQVVGGDGGDECYGEALFQCP